jgi:hypothetical protein
MEHPTGEFDFALATIGLCSAAVPGCGFGHRLGACLRNWWRDATVTRRRGRLRYDSVPFPHAKDGLRLDSNICTRLRHSSLLACRKEPLCYCWQPRPMKKGQTIYPEIAPIPQIISRLVSALIWEETRWFVTTSANRAPPLRPRRPSAGRISK